jgi:hypothetical protein
VRSLGADSRDCPLNNQALRIYGWDVRSVVKKTDAELKALPVAIEGLARTFQ